MDHNIRKRKKKKSLVQTVKKKFKKNFSRTLGTRLDSDIHEYFLRVFQQSKQEFTDADSRRIFVENVFTQTEGHEIEYSSNQLVSRIIEGILPECSDTVLLRYLKAFGEDLRPLCCHQFASHVLETLLKISSKKVFEKLNGCIGKDVESDVTADNAEVFLNFVLKVSKFLLNNLDEFMLDTYANHVTRSAVQCLSGSYEDPKNHSKITFKDNNQHDTSSQKQPKKEYPNEFKELLLQFADRILNSHMFFEYASNVLLSGLVQSVLLSLYSVRNKKYLNSISLKLVDSVYSRDEKEFDVLEMLTYQQAVHLLNTMIITSSDKVYEEIRRRCFAGRLKDLAVSKTANYSVQKLIERSPGAESFDSIYNELSDSFEQIIQSCNFGVLFSLSKMCHKLQTKEKAFIKDLMRSLGCIDSENNAKERSYFALRLLTLNQSLREYECTGSSNFTINLHGCLIMQETLKFRKPDKVIKSLLDIDSALFLRILCDQKGSHIADAVFGGEMKKCKYRNQFMDKLKNSYVSLAVNKYGSFVLTSLWKVADVDYKLSVIKELASKVSQLRSTPSGNLIAKTVGLETYQHQPKGWENAQKQLFNSRQLFSDVIQ